MPYAHGPFPRERAILVGSRVARPENPPKYLPNIPWSWATAGPPSRKVDRRPNVQPKLLRQQVSAGLIDTIILVDLAILLFYMTPLRSHYDNGLLVSEFIVSHHCRK